MKLFIDTADVNEIREAASWGILDGVTTNPSLVAKTGRDFESVIKEICAIVDGPINAEVVSTEAPGMVEEGERLARVHRNIYVKVPMTVEGLKATKMLSDRGIRVNVTLIFSPAQALLASKAGARFLSPFVGRLDDVGHDGMAMVAQIVQILHNYEFPAEVLVASVRTPEHVIRSAEMGAHIATCPFSVLQQLVKHPLTDSGLERFLADWKKVPQRA
ncbi:MAG: fructose-6-phosphate aldolase [Deltaproteobacteria bacterium]|nr:fructose-6-phosphate aldolase [Deltaproteobacteria bacterium]MBI3387738.1 fructose-6-phosphate aldolase [Deltaproteobacteria bacterium]